MEKIEKYIRQASIQKEDDLVFPNQDWKTLEMNLMNVIKNKHE